MHFPRGRSPPPLPGPAPSHRPGARAWALRGSGSGVCGSPGANRRTPLSEKRSWREQRKRTDCRSHRYELPSWRPVQALRFPPRFSSSLSAQIQETMNSHSFLVTKEKGKLLLHPLHVPCFHQVHRARRRAWSEAPDAQDAQGRVPCGSPLLPGLWQPHLPSSLRGVGAGCDSGPPISSGHTHG